MPMTLGLTSVSLILLFRSDLCGLAAMPSRAALLAPAA
jgi:hypothetical protein